MLKISLNVNFLKKKNLGWRERGDEDSPDGQLQEQEAAVWLDLWQKHARGEFKMTSCTGRDCKILVKHV